MTYYVYSCEHSSNGSCYEGELMTCNNLKELRKYIADIREEPYSNRQVIKIIVGKEYKIK